MGLDWFGSLWVGSNRIGRGGIGLGLNRIGLDRMGSERMGSDIIPTVRYLRFPQPVWYGHRAATCCSRLPRSYSAFMEVFPGNRRMLLSPVFLRRVAEVNDRVRRTLGRMSLDCVKGSQEGGQPASPLLVALLFALQVHIPPRPPPPPPLPRPTLIGSLSPCPVTPLVSVVDMSPAAMQRPHVRPQV